MILRPLSRLRVMRGWRADLAAAGLGALAALALPPLYVLPALLVAFPGLLALLEGAPGPFVAARRGFWFGFGLHLVGLYWITEAILIEAARFWWFVPIAVPGLSAILAVFIAGPAGVAWLVRPGWPRALALAGAWVLGDLARQFAFTGFPWNPLGSVWELPGRAGDVLIQPAAWIGVHGLTFLTVLLACVPTLGGLAWLGGALLLAGWIGAGAIRLSEAPPPSPDLVVALVQGNVAQGQKWDRQQVIAIFRHYLALTASAVAGAGGKPVVVVWPETASPFLLERDADARRAVAAAAGGGPVLAGTVSFDAQDHPRNSLAAITPEGDLAWSYDKWHLVPFGEFQPRWLPIPIQVVPGGGFAPGPGPKTYRMAGIPPVGPLICYEAAYSGEMVDPDDRPAWLVNITNDAWFGNSSGPRQHLAAARLRAVENGLPLMRAANTGISAGFDAFGRELGRLGMGQAGFLTLRLPGALAPPLYARYGLAIPALIAALSLGLAFFGSRVARPGGIARRR